MINHSTKSLPRRHKDVSQVPNSSCVLRGWFTVHTPGATFTWVVSGWIQKLGFLEMPRQRRCKTKVGITCEKLSYLYMYSVRWWPCSLFATFSCNNGHPVSNVLHKSNRLQVCLSILVVGGGGGGGGGCLKQQYLSQPAVQPHLPLSLRSLRLIYTLTLF